MGKDGELVINKRSVYEIVKGKEIGNNGKIITSWDEFDKMCMKRRFVFRLGGDVVDMVFDHHNIVDDKAHERSRFISFLNGKQDQIIMTQACLAKRQRLDMSFEESVDNDLDVSMCSQQDDDSSTIEELRRQLKERDEVIRQKEESMTLMGENYRAKVRELQSEIKELKNEGSRIENLFARKKRYNEFVPEMKCLSIKCLSYGMSARHLNYCLEEVAHALDLPDNVVPSDRTLRDWRQNLMPGYNQELIDEFIKTVDSFSMLMDCTSMSGSSKISAIGLAECGNESNCIVLDFYPSNARTGDDLFNQIKKRIERQNLSELIIKKTKNLMTDQGSTQVRANRLLMEYFNQSPHRQNVAPLITIYCGLHTTINCDSRLCRNMLDQSKDAFTLHQLLKRLVCSFLT